MRKFAITLILVSLIICCVACKHTSNEANNEKTFQYEKLKMDLELQSDEDETCCNASETKAVFSIGKPNGKHEGPMVNTERLILYDLEMDSIQKSFDLKKDEYIYNAAPYKDGIIYSDYEEQRDSVNWSVIYISDAGSKTIAKGKCESYDRMPYVTCINGKVGFIYEDLTQNYKWGIKIVEEGEETKEIYQGEDTKLRTVSLYSSGENYVFPVTTSDGDTYLKIGNLQGIQGEYKTEDQMNDFDINDEFMLCSLGSDGNSKLVAMNLDNGKMTEAKFENQLYRLRGSGESFVCVDGSYNVYSITVGNTINKTNVSLPEELTTGADTVSLISMGKNKYLGIFTVGDETYYYKMS